jgi:hypothetical protein
MGSGPPRTYPQAFIGPTFICEYPLEPEITMSFTDIMNINIGMQGFAGLSLFSACCC